MISTFSLILLSSLADRPPDPAALPLPPEPLRAGFRAIEEADLRAWVGFLASEELEGRETGARGYDVAARLCASVFERYGLKPAGDRETYFQEFGVVLTEPDLEGSGLEVADASGTERFAAAGHLALSTAGTIEWEQPWVFVGTGRGADSDAPDPFRGIPLADRVVMVLPPPGVSRFESRGAVAGGARRIAVISDGRVKSRLGLSREENAQFLEKGRPPAGPEVVFLSRAAANRLLRTRGVTVEALESLPERRFDLEGIRVRLTLKRKTIQRSTRNVVGFLEGSDPELRSQVLSVGAHLDHLGAQDGKVFRGADDDASGTSGVLALVKAFAESPRRPSRSIVFCLFAGEEKGLWGSRYFVEHPPVPLERFFCHLQMDMIGRNEERPPKEPAGDNTNSLHLVGAERASREVHRAVLSANRFVGLDLEYDEEEVVSRSDQIHFAERGVPIAFFFTGFHPDYHQPTDTPERINYPKLARILRLIFASAYGLADHPAPLRRIGRR